MLLAKIQKFKSFNSEIKSHIDYSKNYKNHLYCSEKGCEAQLDFVQVDNRYPKKYFRTHPRSKHSSNCPNRFENIANTASKNGENLYVKLSDEQKRRILFDTHKKAIGVNTFDSDSKTGRKSSIVDKNKNSKKTSRYTSTVDPDAHSIPEGIRHPQIRKRECNELTEKDIKITRAVYGQINNVDIGDNYININVLSEKNGEVHFEFYTPFQNNSKPEWEMLRNNIKNYEQLGDIITAIGIVDKRNDEYYISIIDAKAVAINNMNLTNYFSNKLKEYKNL